MFSYAVGAWQHHLVVKRYHLRCFNEGSAYHGNEYDPEVSKKKGRDAALIRQARGPKQGTKVRLWLEHINNFEGCEDKDQKKEIPLHIQGLDLSLILFPRFLPRI